MSRSGYTKGKLSFTRKAIIAAASVTREKNAIHLISEVDVTEPQRMIAEYKRQTGEVLSFTGYITKCLANTILKHPQMNSFISRNRIVVLDEITISLLVEREIVNETAPEPLVIRNCGGKDYREIHAEIRSAQQQQNGALGSLSNSSWLKWVPSFLLKTFVRIADRSITMGRKYGKVAITAVGMFSKNPLWLIPHGSATVLLSIGSFVDRVVAVEERFEVRRHLCLTVSFDHDLIDGAPAARFVTDLVEEIKDGKALTPGNTLSPAGQSH